MSAKKILIVEDDRMLSTVYKMFIKDLGHDLVAIVPDGNLAIEKCGELKPDVVLMDIHIQGEIDGIATAKIIQEKYNLPIIYISGITDDKTIQRAIGSKSYGYLVKPVDKTELGISIELAYNKHNYDKELLIRESRYRTLVQDLPDALLLVIDNKIEYINFSGLKLFGTIHIEEMIGLNIDSILEPSSVKKFNTLISLALDENKKISINKLKFKGINNEIFLADVSGSIINYKNSKTLQLIIRDISEIEHSKDTVREQDNIIDNLYDGILTLSLAGKIKFINKGAERIFEIDRSNVKRKSFASLFPEIDENFINEHILEPALEKQHHELEFTFKSHKNKELKMAHFSLSTLKNVSNETTGIVCYCRDITNKKQIEKKLKESEEKFKLLSITNNDAYWDWEINSNKIYFSSKLKMLLGYNDNEFRNSMEEIDSRLEPNDRLIVNKLLNEHISGKMPIYSSEYRLMHKDGNYRWVLDRGLAMRDENGVAYRMIGTIVDITDYKNSQQIIKRSEANLKAIFNSNKEAILLVDNNYKILDLNKKALTYSKILFEQELCIGDSILDLHNFISFSEAKDLYNNTLNASITHNLERTISVNGTFRTLEISIYPIIEENCDVVDRFCVSIFDVTDRKKIEKDLKETRAELKPMFDSSIQRFYLSDFDFKLVAFNRTAFETIKDDLGKILKKGDNILEFVPNEVGRELFIQRFNAARKGEHISYKDNIQTNKGNAWVETHIEPISNEKGEIIRVLIWTLDITKEHKAEEALIESQKKYYSLFSEANDAILLINDDNDKLVDCNEKAIKLFQYSHEELSTLKLIDLSAPVQRDGTPAIEARQKIIDDLKGGGKKYTFPWSYRKKNGEIFDTEVSLSIVSYGNTNYRYAIVRDITDRLQMEKDLVESEQRTKSLIQAIPDLIFIIDKEGVYKDFMADNEKVYNVPVDNIVGKSINKYFTGDKKTEFKNCILKAIETAKLQKLEYQLDSSIGVRWFEARITKLNEHEVLCLVRDIQEQKS